MTMQTNNAGVGPESVQDFLTTPAPSGLTGGWAMTVWANFISLPAVGASIFFAYDGGSYVDTTEMWMDPTGLVGVAEASGSYNGSTLSLGRWYHAALSYLGSTTTLYIDGVVNATVPGSTTNMALLANINFG